MTGPLKALFRRDLMLALRVGGGAMIGVIFFLTVVTIIPFGVGPDMNLLARIGPRHPVDRGAAGDLARPRPAVPGRCR